MSELSEIQKRHINFLVQNHREDLKPEYGSDYINVRCPLCKNYHKKEKKGYFVFHGDHVYYKCFKGDCPSESKAMSFKRFLDENREYFFSEYISYNDEVLFKKSTDLPSSVQMDFSAFSSKKKVTEDELDHYRKFVSIKKWGPFQDQAMKYVTDRKIPMEVWSRWFVAHEGKYRGRLIIPFYDSKDRIKYFQGRSLVGAEPKYLNKVGAKSVYNLDFVDPTKTVFLFEGVIDSLHCENSVAVLGLGDMNQIASVEAKCPNVCYCMDDDQAGRAKAVSFLMDGKKVFLWKKFKDQLKLGSKGKWDFNDIVANVLKKEHIFPQEEMEKYVSSSFYDKFWL